MPARLTLDQAAELTWQRVSLEHDPDAAHRLSADIVATCCAEHERPIISVIHLDDRRHWNLTVDTALPQHGDVSATAGAGNLVDVLDHARDGELILVMAAEGAWTLTVDVLEPAKV